MDYEDKCIPIELIDEVSGLVLDKLKRWADEEIFNVLGGKLSVEKPLKESVNAAACVNPSNPFHPTIIIHLGMIKEIYRDALTFPLMSERIAETSGTFIAQNWDRFKEYDFLFESGVPDISDDELSGISRALSDEWISAVNSKDSDGESDHSKSRLVLEKTIRSRFLIFELLLTWVFFHELSHIIQCHYKLKQPNDCDVTAYEIEKTTSKGDIYAQSREILADVEGLALTVSYMKRDGFFNKKSCYLLLSAVTCMFNRFYSGSYDNNFSQIKGSHPHPIIRDEFMHVFFLDYISNSNEESRSLPEIELMEYTYLTVRSSTAASLYWANRTFEFDGKQLPEYMKMKLMVHSKEGTTYINNLRLLCHQQLASIKNSHIYKSSLTKKLFNESFFLKSVSTNDKTNRWYH
ncbi:hypothetical protein [Idiomarina abyssalis]|uniref:hypothetical protein n=1 Tax=Idiomarina abyssalis TaxID=86102 RepID=UPI001CD2ADEF|nr:hypothetical protein [Idiomarina abyssalis]